MGESVYCTLLLNDAYLPGAQVLAHSLRDEGTKKRLAVMVTLTGVTQRTVDELKKLYDYVIPADPVYSRPQSENLQLMGRIDLHTALTKIQLWKQTQFDKIVYVDADIVALRAPDELFDVDAELAACPDIGWPDCFNSGMMVMKPNQETYEKLVKLAQSGQSFDGADQGLLNQAFPNWHRLSFNYNCTIGTNMTYQYAPAFNHYGHNVSMAHFIGENKPWMRSPPPGGDSSEYGSSSGYSSTDKRNTPNDRLTSRWWSVWQRHYGHNNVTQSSSTRSVPSTNGGMTAHSGVSPNVAQLVQKIGSVQLEQKTPSTWSNEGRPKRRRTVTFDEQPSAPSNNELSVPVRSIRVDGGPRSTTPPTPGHEGRVDNRTHYEQTLSGGIPEMVMTPEGPVPQHMYFRTGQSSYHIQEYHPTGEPIEYPINYVPPQYAPPPADLPSPKGLEAFYEESDTFYPNSTWDPTQSAPPPGAVGEAANLNFSNYSNQWDNDPQNDTVFVPPAMSSAAPYVKPIFPWEQKPRAVTRVFHGETPSPSYGSEHSGSEEEEMEPEEEEEEVEDVPPPPPAYQETPWSRYQLENKWDSDPYIRNYVQRFQQRTNLGPGSSRVAPVDGIPSLPVTPNPVRPSQTIEPEGASPEEGEEQPWDPEAKLEELRRLPRELIAKLVTANTAEESVQMPIPMPRVEPRLYSDASVTADFEPEPVQVFPPPRLPKRETRSYSDASVQTPPDFDVGIYSEGTISPTVIGSPATGPTTPIVESAPWGPRKSTDPSRVFPDEELEFDGAIPSGGFAAWTI